MADDLSSFEEADFRLVTSQLSSDTRQTDPSQRIILVGGQAVEIWGVIYGVESPTSGSLTADADWLGSEKDARWLADLLTHKGLRIDVLIPKADDVTPNSAVMFMFNDERKLMMDFLWNIIGPSNDDIRKYALLVEVFGQKFYVLHPYHCLESRFYNLQALEKKRKGNGPSQAIWMLAIIEAYLDQLAKDHHDKDSLSKQCRMLFDLSLSDAGKYCYLKYGFDPLLHVSNCVVQYIGGMFEEKEWPIKLQQVRKRRERWVQSKNRSNADSPP